MAETFREKLHRIDLKCIDENLKYHDLRNLFEAVAPKLSPQDKEEIKKVIQNTDDAETIAAVLQAKAADKNESLQEADAEGEYEVFIYGQNRNVKKPLAYFDSEIEAEDYCNDHDWCYLDPESRFEWKMDYRKAPKAESDKEIYGIELEEKLVDAPQEVIDELIEILGRHGFVLDDSIGHENPSKSLLFGDVHIQVINPESSIDLSGEINIQDQLSEYITQDLINDIHELDQRSNCPITWNFGPNKDGKVTGGLDIMKQYVEESLYEETNFSTKALQRKDMRIITRYLGAPSQRYYNKHDVQLLYHKENIARKYDIIDNEDWFLNWSPEEKAKVDSKQSEIIDTINSEISGNVRAGTPFKLDAFIVTYYPPKNESVEESLDEDFSKDEIYDFLDAQGGYSDYNQKIEDVMDEFNLDRDTAEGIVWDWASAQDREPYAYDDLVDESLDLSDYEELTYPLRDGGKNYQLFRKLENGKGKWAAAPMEMGEVKYDDAFEITYDQARGFEPINNIGRLSRDLGKILLPKRESINEASYGGAYDIEDDMYFTKEELMEFGYDLAEQFSAWSEGNCELSDLYMTSPVDLVMEVSDENSAEHQAKVKIDMRKIKLPRDIYKYSDIILKQWKDSYNEYYDYDEELDEAKKVSFDIIVDDEHFTLNDEEADWALEDISAVHVRPLDVAVYESNADADYFILTLKDGTKKAWYIHSGMYIPDKEFNESLDDEEEYTDFIKNNINSNKNFDYKKYGKYFDKEGKLILELEDEYTNLIKTSNLNEDYFRNIEKEVRDFTHDYELDYGEFVPSKFNADYLNDLFDELKSKGYTYSSIVKDHSKPDTLDNYTYTFEREKQLDEDTVKTSKGKWVNKGKEGTHGEFATKKAADAQRKAMFANEYKGESLEEKFLTKSDVEAARFIIKHSINPKEIEAAQKTIKSYKEQQKEFRNESLNEEEEYYTHLIDEDDTADINEFVNEVEIKKAYDLVDNKVLIDSLYNKYVSDYKKFPRSSSRDSLDQKYSKDHGRFYTKWKNVIDKCKDIVKNYRVTGYGKLDYIVIKLLDELKAMEYNFPYGWKYDVNESLNELYTSDPNFERKAYILDQILTKYPDISQRDEDYLGNLSYDEMIRELKNRGLEFHERDWEKYEREQSFYKKRSKEISKLEDRLKRKWEIANKKKLDLPARIYIHHKVADEWDKQHNYNDDIGEIPADYVMESLNEAYSIGYVKGHPYNQDMIYSVSIEGPYDNRDGEKYNHVNLTLVCGKDYVDSYEYDGQAWVDAEQFVDDVQFEVLVWYPESESLNDVFEENEYVKCGLPHTIWHYDEEKDNWYREYTNESLKEESIENKVIIPKPFNRYFEIDNSGLDPKYDIMPGDEIEDYGCHLLGYLFPKKKYEDKIDMLPILTDDPNYPVVELAGGRLYPVDSINIYDKVNEDYQYKDDDSLEESVIPDDAKILDSGYCDKHEWDSTKKKQIEKYSKEYPDVKCVLQQSDTPGLRMWITYISESLKEDYQHKDDEWGDPYTYDEVERELKKITNDFTAEGTIRCYWEQEKEFGEQILSQHFEKVESSDGRTGPGEDMSWVISYSRPKEEELIESLNEARTSGLQDAIVDCLDYFIIMEMEFPKGEFLADSWEDVKDGIQMGIDPEFEVAEGIVEYLKPIITFNKKYNKEVGEEGVFQDEIEMYNELVKEMNKYLTDNGYEPNIK